MKVLLIVAQGNEDHSVNDEAFNLVFDLRKKLSACYDSVSASFLESVQPSVSNALKSCIVDGADEIDILPYCLASGHVAEKLASQVQSLAASHSTVTLAILRPIENAEAINSFVADTISA